LVAETDGNFRICWPVRGVYLVSGSYPRYSRLTAVFAFLEAKKRAGNHATDKPDPLNYGVDSMPDRPEEASRTKVVRLGDYIAIQWLTQKGTPMQTITLSIPDALRVAKEV